MYQIVAAVLAKQVIIVLPTNKFEVNKLEFVRCTILHLVRRRRLKSLRVTRQEVSTQKFQERSGIVAVYGPLEVRHAVLVVRQLGTEGNSLVRCVYDPRQEPEHSQWVKKHTTKVARAGASLLRLRSMALSRG